MTTAETNATAPATVETYQQGEYTVLYSRHDNLGTIPKLVDVNGETANWPTTLQRHLEASIPDASRQPIAGGVQENNVDFIIVSKSGETGSYYHAPLLSGQVTAFGLSRKQDGGWGITASETGRKRDLVPDVPETAFVYMRRAYRDESTAPLRGALDVTAGPEGSTKQFVDGVIAVAVENSTRPQIPAQRRRGAGARLLRMLHVSE